MNPIHNGGADYEYGDMGNSDTLKLSSRRKKGVPREVKREVKAELVDRISIYGQKEESYQLSVVMINLYCFVSEAEAQTVNLMPNSKIPCHKL